ncbi:MAG: hypothetical protein ABIM50_14005 [Novosphingobium sp.]
MRTLGGILLGIGILIAGLSGLCSLIFFVTEATSPHSNLSDVAMMDLMFGGIPFAIGIGMIFLGRHLIKLGKTG